MKSNKNKPETETKKSIENLPEILPIIPLRNSVLFPHQIIPLAVGREKSLKLLDDFEDESKYIGVVAQRQGLIDDPGPEDLYRWGTVATVLKVIDLPDDSTGVVFLLFGSDGALSLRSRILYGHPKAGDLPCNT